MLLSAYLVCKVNQINKGRNLFIRHNEVFTTCQAQFKSFTNIDSFNHLTGLNIIFLQAGTPRCGHLFLPRLLTRGGNRIPMQAA